MFHCENIVTWCCIYCGLWCAVGAVYRKQQWKTQYHLPLAVFLLHYGLLIDRPSSLKVEISTAHVNIGLFIYGDILLLTDLFFQSSHLLGGVRTPLMSSKFLVHCKDYELILTQILTLGHFVG